MCQHLNEVKLAGDVSVCMRCFDSVDANLQCIKYKFYEQTFHPACVNIKGNFYKLIVKEQCM